MKKITPSLFILSVIYCTGCFFILGIITRTFIELKKLGAIDFNIDKIIHLLKMSGIAGFSASLGAWIFAKIDDRKKTDPPSSNSKT